MGALYPTQQDPIGIAGGLNLYGYAGGDPINFSGIDQPKVSALVNGKLDGFSMARLDRFLNAHGMDVEIRGEADTEEPEGVAAERYAQGVSSTDAAGGDGVMFLNHARSP